MENNNSFRERVLNRFKNTDSGTGELTHREAILLHIAENENDIGESGEAHEKFQLGIDYQKQHSDKKYSREEVFEIAFKAFDKYADWSSSPTLVSPSKYLRNWFNQNYPES